MAEPIIIAKEPTLAVKPILTPISGGKVSRWPAKLAKPAEKAWGRVESTTSGDYVLQVRLPDGTVQDLATVAAVVPVGQVAKIDSRIYVNVITATSGPEGGV